MLFQKKKVGAAVRGSGYTICGSGGGGGEGCHVMPRGKGTDEGVHKELRVKGKSPCKLNPSMAAGLEKKEVKALLSGKEREKMVRDPRE